MWRRGSLNARSTVLHISSARGAFTSNVSCSVMGVLGVSFFYTSKEAEGLNSALLLALSKASDPMAVAIFLAFCRSQISEFEGKTTGEAKKRQRAEIQIHLPTIKKNALALQLFVPLISRYHCLQTRAAVLCS